MIDHALRSNFLVKNGLMSWTFHNGVPQRVFDQEVLGREARLSYYWEKIKQNLAVFLCDGFSPPMAIIQLCFAISGSLITPVFLLNTFFPREKKERSLLQ